MTPIQTRPPLPPPPRRNGCRFAVGTAAVLAAGAIVALPAAALAQDDDRDGWLADTLQQLVEDGTLTSEQADAVEGAIEDARPERVGPGPGWFGPARGGAWPLALDEAAEALGIDADELREALRDGESLSEIAAEQGVDIQAVIDALVAAAQERLDEAVAEGDIDAEQADERLADLRERITRFVEEGFPGRFHRFDCDEESGDARPGTAEDGTEDSDPDQTPDPTEDPTDEPTEDTTVTTSVTTPD